MEPVAQPPANKSDPGITESRTDSAHLEEAAEQPRAEEESPGYALDRLSRKAPLRGRLHCPKVEMVRYQGSVVPFQKPLKVYVGFVDHLREFESIVRDTAVEIYGRPPTKIWHYGPNRCRRIRRWPYMMSEHSLGNAIDVGGFEFGRAAPESRADLPPKLRGGFVVNLSLHWTPRNERDEIHSRFLRALARRLIASEGLFTTILGPADRKHKGHFHLDMAARNNTVVFRKRRGPRPRYSE